ncbi:hypothetical protein JZ751_000742, partial [Albula glossodonta]
MEKFNLEEKLGEWKDLMETDMRRNWKEWCGNFFTCINSELREVITQQREEMEERMRFERKSIIKEVEQMMENRKQDDRMESKSLEERKQTEIENERRKEMEERILCECQSIMKEVESKLEKKRCDELMEKKIFEEEKQKETENEKREEVKKMQEKTKHKSGTMVDGKTDVTHLQTVMEEWRQSFEEEMLGNWNDWCEVIFVNMRHEIQQNMLKERENIQEKLIFEQRALIKEVKNMIKRRDEAMKKKEEEEVDWRELDRRVEEVMEQEDGEEEIQTMKIMDEERRNIHKMMFASGKVILMLLSASMAAGLLLQNKVSVTKSGGKTALLTCEGSDGCKFNIHWYQKREGKALKRILYMPLSGGTATKDAGYENFISEIQGKDTFILRVPELKTSDSATYYCACWVDHSDRDATDCQCKTEATYVYDNLCVQNPDNSKA